jgi:polysaccharide biosynthesis transport protein
MFQPNIDRHFVFPTPILPRRGVRVGAGGSDGSDILATLWRALRRHAHAIVAIMLVGSTVATAAVLGITPQYKATALIMVDARRPQILKDQDLLGQPGPGTDSSIVESQVELLRSPALLRRVADTLDLVNNSEFSERGMVARIKRAILTWIGARGGREGEKDDLAPIVDALSRQVDAKRHGLTYVIELSAWSRDPALSARMANVTAQLHLNDQIAVKRQLAQSADQRLSEHVANLRDRVTVSEKAYETYKAEHGLFDLGGEKLSDRQISQLNEQLIQARAKAAEARAKFEQLQKITPENLRDAAASPDVLQSSVIANLRGQYADAAKERAELVTRYGARQPQVRIINAKLRNVSAQISGEIQRIVASARTEYEVAKARQASLEHSLDELKEGAAGANQDAIRLHELEREATANRDLFRAFLGRAKELAAQLNMQLPDSHIVSTASAPNDPSYPRRSMIVGLAFFGSLGLGIAYALARDTLGGGFHRAKDIASLFDLPSVISIPFVASVHRRALTQNVLFGGIRQLHRSATADRDDLKYSTRRQRCSLAAMAIEQPHSAFAERIRSLRFALRDTERGRETKTIMVTSPLPNEGKTSIAANLARATAAAGRHVLLIDADLRQPALAAALNLPDCGGLSAILEGRQNLVQVIQIDPLTGLSAIANSSPISGENAIAGLSSTQMKQLIERARESFDLVVIDAAPLVPVIDARFLVDQVDGVVLVVACEQTSRDVFATAFRETRGLARKVMAVALNKTIEEDEYGRYPSRLKHVQPLARPTEAVG